MLSSHRGFALATGLVIAMALATADTFTNKKTGEVLHGELVTTATKDGEEVMFVRLADGKTKFLPKAQWEARRAQDAPSPEQLKTPLEQARRWLQLGRSDEAEKALRNPQTAREKGLRALVIGLHEKRTRTMGQRVFDRSKAAELAAEALPALAREAAADPISARILGTMYLHGVGVDEDKNRALKYLELAANAGEPIAMNNLGVMCLDGLGTPKNPKQAVEWFRKAAEAGSTQGMLNLFFVYRNGNGVTKDEGKAEAYLDAAAKAGNSDAMAKRAIITGTLYALGRMQVDAQSGLLRLKNGRERQKIAAGLRKSISKVKREKEAFEYWIHKAIAAGNAQAMSFLAHCHEKDLWFGEKDLEEAFKWRQSAAESGVGEYILDLGRCYRKGLGVTRDLRRAAELYADAQSAATAQGDKETLARATLLRKAPLVLTDWRWTQKSGFAVAEGQVQNVRHKPIRNLTALVMFKTEDDKLVTSADALTEFNPVMPGQTTPFRVMARYNPAMHHASVAFKTIGGAVVPHYDEATYK